MNLSLYWVDTMKLTPFNFIRVNVTWVYDVSNQRTSSQGGSTDRIRCYDIRFQSHDIFGQTEHLMEAHLVWSVWLCGDLDIVERASLSTKHYLVGASDSHFEGGMLPFSRWCSCSLSNRDGTAAKTQHVNQSESNTNIEITLCHQILIYDLEQPFDFDNLQLMSISIY